MWNSTQFFLTYIRFGLKQNVQKYVNMWQENEVGAFWVSYGHICSLSQNDTNGLIE